MLHEQGKQSAYRRCIWQVRRSSSSKFGMGTKLQYAPNLSATLPRIDSDAVDIRVDTADSWNCSTKTIPKENTRRNFYQLQESMDRLIEQYNKETIREMILKHEEIFKEQVTELHRLYRVQKMLMAEMRSKELKLFSLVNEASVPIQIGSGYGDLDDQTRYWSTATASQSSRSPFSSSQHSTTQMEYNFHQQYNIRADPSSQEPSSCSGDTFRVQMGFDLERPAEEKISSTSVSAIEDQSPLIQSTSKDKMSVDDEGSKIELTLSIGCGTDKKKRTCCPPSDFQLGCSESNPKFMPSTPVIADQEKECSNSRESLQRPHWLLQALSLNKR